MLRRATTGHRPCLIHNQWRSRPLLLPSPHRQNPFTQRSFSSALALCENESRPDNFQDHPPPTAQSPAPVTDDAPKKEDSLDHAPSDTTQENAGPAQASRERPRTTRLRALRPLLLPPTFPLSLLPVTPVFEPPPSKKRDEAAETNASTTIALAGLPPNTLKTDIRPIFQRFGEVKHMIVHPGGSSADVLFADVHGLRRTLHAYADEPIRVRGQEIAVFRKHTHEAGLSLGAHSVTAENAVLPDKSTSHSFAEQGEPDGAIFVTDFPLDTTQEELSEALGSLGKYERFVMRPDSKYAYFVYQNDDPVKHILGVHRRVPITIRGQTLRIERTPHRPYILSPGPEGHPIEFGKLLDPATSSMIADELKRTVPGWKGNFEPSRVLWIGRLPTDISKEAVECFWSRLGYVVEVRISLNGFAHIEFASTEEALRAARQGAPHGFRYAQRLLDLDFAPWVFYVGRKYRVVHISGWLPTNTQRLLLQWAYDIPNIVNGKIMPPFRGEKRSDPRNAFLIFRSMDDARTGLQKLASRAGPGGEELHLSLSCFPAIHSNRLWRWVYTEEELGEGALSEEWGGLGFGTGHEEEEELDAVSDALGTDAQEEPSPERAQAGTRGGRGHWRHHAEQRRVAEAEDAADNYAALFGTSHEPPAHPNHGEQDDAPPFRAEHDLGAPENEGFGESEDIPSVPRPIAQNNAS